LIAMRNGGGTIGMIAMGSEDGERFYSGGNDLPRWEMASAALARVLRYGHLPDERAFSVRNGVGGAGARFTGHDTWRHPKS
jgi:hypothetical protein